MPKLKCVIVTDEVSLAGRDGNVGWVISFCGDISLSARRSYRALALKWRVSGAILVNAEVMNILGKHHRIVPLGNSVRLQLAICVWRKNLRILLVKA